MTHAGGLLFAITVMCLLQMGVMVHLSAGNIEKFGSPQKTDEVYCMRSPLGEESMPDLSSPVDLIMESQIVYDHNGVKVADSATGMRLLIFDLYKAIPIVPYCDVMSIIRLTQGRDTSSLRMSDEVLTNWDTNLLRGAFTGYQGGEHIHKSLHVGIGGGVTPTWIERHCPDADVQAADISADVVGALPLFGVTNTTRKTIYLQDGRKLVEAQADNSVDIIFIDAVDNMYRVPKCLQTADFFRTVYSKLVPGGVIVINTVLTNFEQGGIVGGLRGAFPEDSILIAYSIDNRYFTATKPGGSFGRPDAYNDVLRLNADRGTPDFRPVHEQLPWLRLAPVTDADAGCV
jgi:predicted O-methyltransferase YrrM